MQNLILTFFLQLKRPFMRVHGTPTLKYDNM